MGKRTPSLDIVRPVLNIGEHDIEHVVARHFQKVEATSYLYETVQGFFYPIDALRASIITNREFLNVQSYLGARSLDKERVEELASHLREKLPGSGETTDVPTLPTQFRPVGKSIHIITIAGSPEVLGQRVSAKEKIGKFLKLTLPGEVWFPDDEVTSRVWFASTDDDKETGILRLLDATMNEEEPLPDDTELGERKVRVSA